MNLIEELFYGNICPSEQGYRDNPEIYQLGQELVALEEKLVKTFSDEQKRMYEDFMSKEMTRNSIEIKDKFVYGFQLGVQLLLDASQAIKI